MKNILILLFGFILFNAQFGEKLTFVLKMDDKSGKTWVLLAEDKDLVWREIEHTDEVKVPARYPIQHLPREQWLQK